MKTHTLSMRVFSVLLCVAMLCTFAPLTSVAKTAMPDVFVGGVQVTKDNAADILGDGTASYDKATKTLTLKTVGIYKAYETEDGAAYGIYADGDLTVVLDGKVNIDLIGLIGKAHAAAIEATGDLTVIGYGSLSCNTPATASFSAGLVAGGSLLVDVDGAVSTMPMSNGDSLELTAGKAPQSYAFYGENVTLTLAKIRIFAMAYTRLCNVTSTLKHVECVFAMGATDVDGSTTSGYRGSELCDVFDELCFLSVEPVKVPRIEVAGTWVTMDNADDVLGDGTVSYDFKAKELVLNNATITGFCGDYSPYAPEGPLSDIAGIYTDDDITIRLIGDNVIDLRDSDYEIIPLYNQGIYTDGGNLTLVGSGNFTAYAGPSKDEDCGSYGAYVNGAEFYGNGDYAFYGASEDADASYGICAYAITVFPSRYEEDAAHGVRFVGETAAIDSDWEYFSLDFPTTGSHDVLCAQTTNADDLAAADETDNRLSTSKYAFFASKELMEHNLWVGGVQVTSNNYTDVLGDGGSVRYEEYYESYDDQWYRTLILNNATITDAYRYDDYYLDESHFAYEGIYSRVGNLTVILEGDNAIDLTGMDVEDASYIDGIFCPDDGYLELSGSGSLTIKLPEIATDSMAGISQDRVIVGEGVALTVVAPNLANAVGIYADSSCEIFSTEVFLTAGEAALSTQSVYVDPGYTDVYTGNDYNDANAVKNADVANDDNLKYYRTLKTDVPTYDLWVGGVQVTQENAYDIQCTSGYDVYFANYSNTLTLWDATIDAGNVPLSEGLTMCGGIVSKMDSLTIELVGNNVINVSDEQANGLVGIFSASEKGTGNVFFTGDGSLTINVQGTEKRQALGIYATGIVSLDNSGAVTITVTGDEDAACGIAGTNIVVCGRDGLNINVQGKDAVGLMVYNDVYFNTVGPVNVTVNSSATERRGEAIIVFGDVSFAPESGTCSFVGSVKAFETTEDSAVDLGGLKMTAYTDLAGENKVESPVVEDLASYKKVIITQPRSVTPVLIKAEAECPREVSDGVFVGNDEAAQISWEVEGTPEYVSVLCDLEDDGTFGRYLEVADCERVSSYSRKANLGETDVDLTGTNHLWRLCAEYGDGTVAYSEPFTVTYYQVLRNYDLPVYPIVPTIGATPAMTLRSSHDIYYSCKDDPIDTWYHVDNEQGIAYEMGSDEIFLPGETYGLTIEETLLDTLRIDGDTLTAHVENAEGAEIADVYYNSENNSLSVGIEFAPLKTQLRVLRVDCSDIDETKTPADMTYTALGNESLFSGLNTYPVAGGAINAVWTYCDGDTYDAKIAKVLGNNQAFATGRSYLLTVTVPLADRFSVSDDAVYVFADTYEPVNGVYDASENVVTVTIPIGYIDPVVKALDLTVFEPEVEMRAGSAEAWAATDYVDTVKTTWYALDGDGNQVKTLESGDQFEAGVTYLAQFDVTLESKAYFSFPSVTITVNGDEPCFEKPYKTEVLSDETAVVYALYTVSDAEVVTTDTLDFTVAPFTANDTPADVTIGFDDTLVSAVQTTVGEYSGENAPATFMDAFLGTKFIDKNDRFEYGKTYVIRMSYTLKANVQQDISKVVLNVNGEKSELTYLVDSKRGAMLALVTLNEPTIALSAETTEFEFSDEARQAVCFDVEYGFELANTTVVVYDADEDEVFSAEVDGTKDSFTADLSALEIGTYTVVVAAVDGKNTVVSNGVDLVVKADPTTTATETEPTATETEPSVTATEVEPTVTETEPTETKTEPSVTASKETTEPTAKPTVAPTASKETTKPTAKPTVAPTESKEPTVTEVTPTATETEPTIAPTEVEPTATATGTDVPSFILYGDANNDGVVNMKDVLALRKHIAGIEILIHPLNSDANADGDINMKDVLAVRKFIAGLVDHLGA